MGYGREHEGVYLEVDTLEQAVDLCPYLERISREDPEGFKAMAGTIALGKTLEEELDAELEAELEAELATEAASSRSSIPDNAPVNDISGIGLVANTVGIKPVVDVVQQAHADAIVSEQLVADGPATIEATVPADLVVDVPLVMIRADVAPTAVVAMSESEVPAPIQIAEPENVMRDVLNRDETEVVPYRGAPQTAVAAVEVPAEVPPVLRVAEADAGMPLMAVPEGATVEYEMRSILDASETADTAVVAAAELPLGTETVDSVIIPEAVLQASPAVDMEADLILAEMVPEPVGPNLGYDVVENEYVNLDEESARLWAELDALIADDEGLPVEAGIEDTDATLGAEATVPVIDLDSSGNIDVPVAFPAEHDGLAIAEVATELPEPEVELPVGPVAAFIEQLAPPTEAVAPVAVAIEAPIANTQEVMEIIDEIALELALVEESLMAVQAEAEVGAEADIGADTIERAEPAEMVELAGLAERTNDVITPELKQTIIRLVQALGIEEPEDAVELFIDRYGETELIEAVKQLIEEVQVTVDNRPEIQPASVLAMSALHDDRQEPSFGEIMFRLISRTTFSFEAAEHR